MSMSRIKHLLFIWVASLQGLMWSAHACADQNARCFSDMAYHKTEGDIVGLTICLMSHRGGVSVIHQEAAGKLETPLLTEGQFENGKLTFKLPSTALTPGTWEALLKKREIVVRNPAGNTYRLKQRATW